MNPVLTRLLEQRQEQLDFVDQLLERIAERGGDMVDAERSNLEAARQRVAEIDAQITPLQEFESIRGAHDASTAGFRPSGRDGERRELGGDRGAAPQYRNAGEFIVDHLRGHRSVDRLRVPGWDAPDPDAAQRTAAALATRITQQITPTTPGLLPEPIVGQVVNLIDASRPLITSLGGAKSMGGIPGKTFSRPKVTQHTQSGKQANEKSELASRNMIIDSIDFAKETHGGAVNVSRQDIDWTSPGAWQIVVEDLADSYALDSENTVAADFVASITTNTSAVASGDLAGWAAALYDAAAKCYAGGKKLPDRLWCSVDMWGAMGPLVDVAKLVFPQAANGGAGTSQLSDFGGYVLDLPRYVVPEFPAGTMIIGRSTLYEAYEEVIGLLSVVEPSILGVEVAYGGYIAYGNLEEKGFAKVTGPAAAE